MFIDDNKIKVEHPEMSPYQRIVQRVQAINALKEWPLVHKLVIDELGKRGLAHKPRPLTSGLLLDSTGFFSDAFGNKPEREMSHNGVAALRPWTFRRQCARSRTSGCSITGKHRPPVW